MIQRKQSRAQATAAGNMCTQLAISPPSVSNEALTREAEAEVATLSAMVLSKNRGVYRVQGRRPFIQSAVALLLEAMSVKGASS